MKNAQGLAGTHTNCLIKFYKVTVLTPDFLIKSRRATNEGWNIHQYVTERMRRHNDELIKKDKLKWVYSSVGQSAPTRYKEQGEVASDNGLYKSLGLQLSWLERTPDKGEVAGSTPARPTKFVHFEF